MFQLLMTVGTPKIEKAYFTLQGGSRLDMI